MFQRFRTKVRDRKTLKSDGTRCNTQYSVIINNDDIKYFPDYSSALDFITEYRKFNQIFNMSLFRIEMYSLMSNVVHKI